MWTEIQQAQEHQRHELVLTGAEIAQRIAENGLDEHVYDLIDLNFLEISRTSVALLDNKIGSLRNLSRLVLHNNKLKELPEAVGRLTKLKFLDVSQNELSTLPSIFATLTDLQSLNASVNSITSISDLSHCVRLTNVDLSHNKLENFPEALCCGYLANLIDIKLNNNVLVNISPEIVILSGLKQIDLSFNQITEIPKELSECQKLKEVLLADNPIKDSRLKKLTAQKPPKSKAVLDYIREHCAYLGRTVAEEGGKKGAGKPKKKKGGKGDDSNEVAKDEIQVTAAGVDSKRIVVKPSVVAVRPYIVCCILRNLQLEEPAKLQKFISIQTGLHDDLCEKRMSATIATHDLDAIDGDIVYEARVPSNITLQPLKRNSQVTAQKLVGQLEDEAETLRKEKKRNTFSGIHKYLTLLQDKPLYACLTAKGDGTVISFPPITNSEKTKVSVATKNVLLEVTSTKSLAICKTVIEKLLLECFTASLVGVAAKEEEQPDADEAAAGDHAEHSNVKRLLLVEQVKIFDESGELRVVYPSRVDLNLDQLNVVRDQ